MTSAAIVPKRRRINGHVKHHVKWIVTTDDWTYKCLLLYCLLVILRKQSGSTVCDIIKKTLFLWDENYTLHGALSLTH